jgi:hypothetical protein
MVGLDLCPPSPDESRTAVHAGVERRAKLYTTFHNAVT